MSSVRKEKLKQAQRVAKHRRQRKLDDILNTQWSQFLDEWNQSYQNQKQKMIDDGLLWDPTLDHFYNLTRTEYLFGFLVNFDSKGEHSISTAIHNLKMGIYEKEIQGLDMVDFEESLLTQLKARVDWTNPLV